MLNMIPLTEGAIDKIMNGVDVDMPVLQILGHKKLASSSSGDRYRLLVSDGKRINSFTMLATQLNSMVTDNLLTEFSICQINRYAISMVNSSGKQKRVMVILNLDVKVPGEEVGSKIGNPMNVDSSEAEQEPKPAQPNPSTTTVPDPNQTGNAVQKGGGGQSLISPEVATTPIAALSPYQNRWVIKVRVTSKSPIRTWSNSRGEGKLFSMDLVDESSEIRCTAFRELCDKFYDMIEVGSIYFISRCGLKPANKQFNYLKNDYEMTLNSDSEIIPCHEDTTEIPTIQFNFAAISTVEEKEKNSMIDILGVTKSCSDVQTIVSRSGKELKKRDVNLVDESKTMVCLTLWGTQAEEFNVSDNPIVAVKGARIGEFNGGRTLSTLSSTVLHIDPDIPEAHKLRGWYNSVGKMEEPKLISKQRAGGSNLSGPWLVIEDAMDMNLGRLKADVFISKATINLMKVNNALYKSCPADGCKKKVVDMENGMYTCEKCAREYPTFTYRMLGQVHLADSTGNLWATAFSEEAEKLLGMKAQDLGELMVQNHNAYLAKFAQAVFKDYMFKIRAKIEAYNDEERMRYTLLAVTPVDYKTYNKYLVAEIHNMAGIGKT